jgi:hypothetical protein
VNPPCPIAPEAGMLWHLGNRPQLLDSSPSNFQHRSRHLPHTFTTLEQSAPKEASVPSVPCINEANNSIVSCPCHKSASTWQERSDFVSDRSHHHAREAISSPPAPILSSHTRRSCQTPFKKSLNWVSAI